MNDGDASIIQMYRSILVRYSDVNEEEAKTLRICRFVVSFILIKNKERGVEVR